MVLRVFPRLRPRGAEHLRLWVPGCATGEVVYALAAALLAHLDGQGLAGARVRVLGTDPDEAVLRTARAGRYGRPVLARLGRPCLQHFFRQAARHYEARPRLREACVFGRHDLARDPPFSGLDLVWAGRALAGVGAQERVKLVRLFHAALAPTGFLVLGGVPLPADLAALFEPVDRRHGVFARKGPPPGAGRALPSVEPPPPARPLAARSPAASRDPQALDGELKATSAALEAAGDELLRRDAELARARDDLVNLVEAAALAVVIVDSQQNIRFFTPAAARDLGLGPDDVGRPLASSRLGEGAARLAELVQAAVSERSPGDHEFRDRGGRRRSLRVRPYVSGANPAGGAVLSLVDVHDPEVAGARFRAPVEPAPEAMVMADAGGSAPIVNAQAERLFGYLSGVVLQLEGADDALATDLEAARAHLRCAREQARAGLTALRAMRPAAPEPADLPRALRLLASELASATGLAVEASVQGRSRPLGRECEEDLLRIAEQALTNVAQHARAAHVRAELRYRAEIVHLRIVDDGQGFAQAAPTGGLGLVGMRERAQRMGARLRIRTQPGRGTAVSVLLRTPGAPRPAATAP